MKPDNVSVKFSELPAGQKFTFEFRTTEICVKVSDKSMHDGRGNFYYLTRGPFMTSTLYFVEHDAKVLPVR